MNYLSRLVQQSRLQVGAPIVQSRLQSGVQTEPDIATSAIEEINIEVPAHAPVGLSVAPQQPPVKPAALSTTLPEGARQRQDPTEPDRPQNATIPDNTPDIASSTSDVARTVTAAGTPTDPSPSGKPQEMPTEIQSTITRHETLQQVFDWIAPNETHQRNDIGDGFDPKPAMRLTDDISEMPTEPTAATASEKPTEVRAMAADIVTSKATPAPVIPRPAVEIAMRPEAAPPEKVLPHEVVEERVDISIGAINVTVEAPPAPPPAQAPPAISMMRPPTAAPPLPASPRSPAFTSDRLRRRFIKL